MHTNTASTDPQGPQKLTIPLARQFELALVKKDKEKVKLVALPDLDAIQVAVVSDDDIANQIEEARGRSAYAQKAAQKIIMIRARVTQINLVKERGGMLTSGDVAELKKLAAEEEKILGAGDEELQKSLRFALFIEEIRSGVASAENALAFLARAVEIGRFREPTDAEKQAFRAADNKYPSGTLFYAKKAYLSVYTGGPQRALEAELRKFIGAVKKNDGKAERAEIEFILQNGEAELGDMRRGIVGVYALNLPHRETNGKVFRAGAALVSLEKKKIGKGGEMPIVKIVRGAGTLAWMNEHKGRWISLSSYCRYTSDKNLEGELLEFSNKFIRTLEAAVTALRRSRAA